MSISTEQTGKLVGPRQRQEVAGIQHVLKNRHFLLLWMAQLISQTILNAANFALVALVSARPDGALMASLAVIAFTLPAVPFSVVAGAIVDKLDKRLVLWVTNLLRVGTMLLMFCWLVYDSSDVWPLFGFIFLTSLIGQFFTPAEGTAIPLLVGERELMSALSLFNITATLAQAIGFLLLGRVVVAIFPEFMVQFGSLKLDIVPTSMVFVVVAFFYAVCTVLILFIPHWAFHETHLQKQDKSTSMSFGKALETLWRDMVEGWHIVRTDRLLFFSVVQLSVVGIIMQLIGALAGTFVKVILERSTEDMSIVLAPAAVGLVGASLLMPRFTERVGKIRLTFIGLIGLAVGFALLPVLHWTALYLDPVQGAKDPLLFWVVILLVFGLGVAMASVNIPTMTMMQERAPEEGRARVLSLQFMLYSAGTIPVLLFAGVIAQLFGFGQIVLIISASILLFCLWGRYYLHRGKQKDEQIKEAYEVEKLTREREQRTGKDCV
jgi:MFS family permease